MNQSPENHGHNRSHYYTKVGLPSTCCRAAFECAKPFLQFGSTAIITLQIFLSLSTMTILPSCSKGKPQSLSSALSEWSPEIDQPIGQLEELLNELKEQQPMNYTASNIAFLYDVKLRLIFQDHIDRLEGATRTRAIEQQRRWLLQREKAVEEAYLYYDGGSGAPLAAAQASMEATKKRIAELVRTVS